MEAVTLKGSNMADKIDDKDVVGYRDVILAEAVQSEALVNLLVKKGIMTKDELITEVIRVKERMAEDQARKRKFTQ